MAHTLSSRIALAGFGFTLVLAMLATSVRADDEPEVDGKKGAAWVDILNKSDSARQRALAVEALLKLWIEKQYIHSLPTIGRALQVDSSVAVRTQAALALGSLRESEVEKGHGAQDLIDAMGREKNSKVRLLVAKAIARYKGLPALAAGQLTAALKDPEPVTRAAVAEAIALAGPAGKSAAAELAPLLKDDDKGVRRAAVAALGRISPEGASAVAETMTNMLATEKELDVRIELITSIQLLGEKSPAVVSGLGKLLTDPDDEIRRRSVRTLGSFGTASAPVAEELLKVATSDKAKDISVDAVYAFGSAIGPDQLKKRLKDVLSLLSEPDFRVRIAAINEVSSLGNELKDDAETLKLLRARYGDPHIRVREAARAAVERIEKKPEPKKNEDPKKGE